MSNKVGVDDDDRVWVYPQAGTWVVTSVAVIYQVRAGSAIVYF
jgi:hypothetical protein